MASNGSGGPLQTFCMSVIHGPPAECNTLLHSSLYYTHDGWSEHPCTVKWWVVETWRRPQKNIEKASFCGRDQEIAEDQTMCVVLEFHYSTICMQNCVCGKWYIRSALLGTYFSLLHLHNKLFLCNVQVTFDGKSTVKLVKSTVRNAQFLAESTVKGFVGVVTLDHATVPWLMCWRCPCDATVLLIMQHCCQSCNSAVDVLALSTGCDSAVDHAVTWLTALSRDWQHCQVIGNTVTCSTAMLCN